MPRLSADEAREQRNYIAAHEDKIRKRLRNGETYVQIAAQLGVSPRVLKQMIEVVLARVGVHRCQSCLTATTRSAPHSAAHG
jgi:DNA-binding NarL/FixJ family response regulator